MVFAKIPTEYDDKKWTCSDIDNQGWWVYHGDIRMKLLNTERLAIWNSQNWRKGDIVSAVHCG